MLKNIFYVLIIALIFGCQPQNNTPKQDKKLPFDGVCGEEYAKTYEIHESLFGDNPTIVVFNKIPTKK